MRTVGVSFSVYISNKIGAEAVGVFGLIMSVYMFAVTFATSGINITCVRIVSEELAYCNMGNIKKVVKQCSIFSLFLGITACIILFICAPYISSTLLHNKVSPIPLYILAISLPTNSICACLNGYFSAVRKVTKTASTQILEQFVKIALTAFFINIFLPSGIDFACLSLVLGSTISEILSFLYLYILYTFEKHKYISKPTSRKDFSRQILRISAPMAFTSYIRSGLSTLKQVIIPLRLEKYGISCERALSQYGIINGMVMPIILFPSVLINSFSSLLIPEFSELNTRNSSNRINNILPKIFKVTLLFSICIIGIFWCFSDELSLAIYNNIEISKFIKILCPLIAFMYLDTIVDSILKALDKQVSVMGINILDLFVSIAFIYFLLPIYGILGYITVIFISEILNSTVSLRELLKISNFKIDYINWIIKPTLSAIATNFIIFLLPFQNSNSYLYLAIHIFVYILFYLVIIVSLGCISIKDFKSSRE